MPPRPPTGHPLHGVVVVGVHNTRQARVLDGTDSRTITLEAALGALDDAGLSPRDVDGVAGQALDLAYQARIGPVWWSPSSLGIPALLDAANAIANGLATTVADGRRFGRRVHRAALDGAVDPSRARVRRVVRDVHRGRVRARRPAAHALLRHPSRRRSRPSPRPSATTGTSTPTRCTTAAVRTRRPTSSRAAWSRTRTTCSTAR